MALEFFEYPALSGNTKQLVVLLHGYGSHGQDLISLAPELAEYAPDAHFVSPHAPHPFEGGGDAYQWYSLVERNDINMLTGASAATPILMEFINEQLARFDLEFDRLAVLGFSQGAMMTMHSLLRTSESAAGLLCYSGFIVAPEQLTNEATAKPPVLLVHGTEDVVVPFSAMEMAEATMLSMGINVEAHARPKLGHGIDVEGIRYGGEFLQKIFA